LGVARGGVRGVGTLAELGERTHGRFQGGDAARQGLIGLRWTRRSRSLLGLGDARVEIGECARIDARRRGFGGEVAHLRFQRSEPRREIIAVAGRAKDPQRQEQHQDRCPNGGTCRDQPAVHSLR
jgi:hypothetical protein